MSTGPASRSASLPRFGRGAAVTLFLLFLLLGVVFTAPLVRHLRHALPYAAVPPPGRELVYGAQGDYLQFYYYLWLVEERLLSGASFLKDPYQFAIDGPRPNLPNIFLPAALLFVPLSALRPSRSRTTRSSSCPSRSPAWRPRSSPAATASPASARSSRASLFACAPYRVGALLGGHPAGLAYPLVPLVLWGVEGALAGSLWSGLARGGALLGLALMEPHFAYFAALGLPLYARGADRPARVAPGVARGRARRLAGGRGDRRRRRVRRARRPRAPGLAGPAFRAARDRGGRRAPHARDLAGAGRLAPGRRAGAGRPRAAARRSLVACLPWLVAATAAGGRGRLVAAALVLPLLVHAIWLLAGWRRWWSPRLPVVPVALAVTGGLAAGGFLLLLQRLLLRRSVTGGGRSLHEVLLFSPTPDDLFTRVNPGVRPDGVPRRRGGRARRPRRRGALAAAPVGNAPDALDLRAPGGRGHHRVPRPPAGGAATVRGRVPPRPLVELHPPAGKGPGPRRGRACRPGGGRGGRPRAARRPRRPGRRGARARAPGRGGLPPLATRRDQRARRPAGPSSRR